MTREEQIFRIAPHWRIVLWLWVYLIFAASILCLAAALPVARESAPFDNRILMAIPAVLLLYMGATQARALFNRQPALKLTWEGIEDGQSGFGLISWDDVVSIEVSAKPIRGVVYRTVHVQVKNADEYFRRVSIMTRLSLPLRSWRKKLVPLDFTHLDGSIEDFLD